MTIKLLEKKKALLVAKMVVLCRNNNKTLKSICVA